MQKAAEIARNWNLDGFSMYVTLEPCTMCAGAIVLARIPVLVFGAYDPKAGGCTSLYTITNDTRLNTKINFMVLPDVFRHILCAHSIQLDCHAAHCTKPFRLGYGLYWRFVDGRRLCQSRCLAV